MGDCALVGDGGARGPGRRADRERLERRARPARATPAAASSRTWQAFIGTPEGRALVGRSGRQEQRAHRSRRQVPQRRALRARRGRGPQPIAGFDRQFWRAFLEVNGRMTVLSGLGFARPQRRAGGAEPARLPRRLDQEAANGGCSPPLLGVSRGRAEFLFCAAATGIHRRSPVKGCPLQFRRRCSDRSDFGEHFIVSSLQRDRRGPRRRCLQDDRLLQTQAAL